MTIPVILLAFANDEGDRLDNLEVERKAIAAALQSFDDRFFIRVVAEPSASIDDLFALFDRFPDQVAIFHYGGHADGTALKLEAAGGANEVAHAGGLAQMLGLSKALKLVFLNGCATHDSAIKQDIHFDGGIAAAVENFAGKYGGNDGHDLSLL